MTFGIGIDTIEVARIKSACEHYGDQFLRRIFSEEEIAYAEARARKWEHLAARFAAKEAYAKALGTGVRRGFTWKEVWVERAMGGRPYIRLSKAMDDRARHIIASPFDIHLSLTHTAELAEAFVTIERVERR